MECIKYEGTNGYTGVLTQGNGKRELVVLDRHLKEVLHTASPAGDTMEWLKEVVDGMPEVMKL